VCSSDIVRGLALTIGREDPKAGGIAITDLALPSRALVEIL
jgi:hypothetical protein